MMGFYRKSVHFFENMITWIEVCKNMYSEKKAIKKKRPLYKEIEWSEQEKERFTRYWSKEYGRAIPNWWHKLYQSVNGVFDERYFPDFLFSTELEWRTNPKKYADVLSDKNLLHTLFRVDNLNIPKTYISCSNGIYQDPERKIINEEKAMELASKIGNAVIKPAIESCSGHNVRIVSMENGIDTRSGHTLKDIMSDYAYNFVIQEVVTPCEEIKTLSPNCLSTFRVITYVTDESIFSAPVSMRVGTGNSDVDNIHAGGLGVGVDNDGKLSKYAYKLGYGDNNEKIEVHPDSEIPFGGYHIPLIPEMIEMAKQCHALIPMLGILSWDFTIDKDRRITLIEVNTQDQAAWFPQMTNGKAMFGDQTQYFINQIKKN